MKALMNVMQEHPLGFGLRGVDHDPARALEVVEATFGKEVISIIEHVGTSAPDDYMVEFSEDDWAEIMAAHFDPEAFNLHARSEVGYVSAYATLSKEN